MAKLKRRIPRKGDGVAVRGEDGTYAVYLVDKSLQSADLAKTGSDLRLASIPWDSLTFLDEEDDSQVAARIVREATEQK
jgi:hypothetical protein